MCLIQMENFKDVLRTKDEELLLVASKIYKQFFVKGAVEEVNLNNAVASIIEAAISQKAINRLIFNEAILELRQLMMPHVLNVRNNQTEELVKLLAEDNILRKLDLMV